MKIKKASKFLKDLITVLVTIIKNQSMAVKTKTARFKTRLLFFDLLNNKKVLMTTISHKMHSLMNNESGQRNHLCSVIRSGATFESYNGAIVPRKAAREEIFNTNYAEQLDFEYFEGEEDHEYPDLTHSLFESEEEEEENCDELELVSSSVIDFVRSSLNEGSTFNIEEEIDNVVDAFIRRHRKQMRLEKQDSFKERYQEMLQGDV